MRLKKASSLLLVTITALFILTGCGDDKKQNLTESTTQKEETQTQEEQTDEKYQSEEMVMSETDSPQKINNSVNQKVASKYYLSLGILDKKVAVEGNNRDRDDFEILNGKIIFPLGSIHSVVVRENEGKEHFINASQKEVNDFINTIENAECITKVTANPDKKSEVVLVYKTIDNDYHTIFVESAENNNFLFKIKEDDRDEFAEIEDIEDRNSGQEYKVVQLKSKKLAKVIKKWMV